MQLDGWELQRDALGRLHLRRAFAAKSFVKALALCRKIEEVAEEESHHPDLHLTGALGGRY